MRKKCINSNEVYLHPKYSWKTKKESEKAAEAIKWHELPEFTRSRSIPNTNYSLSLSFSLLCKHSMNKREKITEKSVHWGACTIRYTQGTHKYTQTDRDQWTANKLKQHIKATKELMTFINCIFCFVFTYLHSFAFSLFTRLFLCETVLPLSPPLLDVLLAAASRASRILLLAVG